MAQILLETLSYSWLVEERATSFEERNAPRNIRVMLKDMGIPVEMPAKFAALAATRSRNGRQASGIPVVHRAPDPLRVTAGSLQPGL